MASIARRPDGRWRARYRDSGGREHARHFRRKVDAQRWLDEVTADVMTGRYVDPRAGKITFSDWYRKWADRQLWATGTREAADQAAGGVTFGSVPIGVLSQAHIAEWIKDMSDRRLAPATIQTRYNFVHMALRGAVTDKRISEDPSAGAKLPRLPRREAALIIPTAAQVAELIDAAPRSHQAFLGVCAFAGLRLGEAAGLDPGNIDFLGRTIMVRRQVQGQTMKGLSVVAPKYGSARDVPIPDDLVTMLSAHLAEVGPTAWEDQLFMFGDGARPMNRNSAGGVFRAARAKVPGTDKFTLHSLRHFYASGLIAAGCDVVTVQRALGHSSPTITLNTYSHLWPNAEDRTRAAARGLWEQAFHPADSARTSGPKQASD